VIRTVPSGLWLSRQGMGLSLKLQLFQESARTAAALASSSTSPIAEATILVAGPLPAR
jgi:hypothetical protein